MKKKLFALVAVTSMTMLLVACGSSEETETRILDENGKNIEVPKTSEKPVYSDSDLAAFNESVDRLIADSNSVVTSITADESGDWLEGVNVTVINDVKEYSEDEKMQIANDYGLSMAGKVSGLLYGAYPEVNPFVIVYYQNGDVMARSNVLKGKMVIEN